MRLKVVASTFAVIAAVALLARRPMPRPRKSASSPQPRHTVFVSRDEDGRTRTRIIIQKRSYLDPGTETFPGESTGNDYVQMPTHHAAAACSTTPRSAATSCRCLVPSTLPSKNNPWLQF